MTKYNEAILQNTFEMNLPEIFNIMYTDFTLCNS